MNGQATPALIHWHYTSFHDLTCRLLLAHDAHIVAVAAAGLVQACINVAKHDVMYCAGSSASQRVEAAMLRTNPGTTFVRVVEQHAACLPSTAPAACSPVAHAPTRVRTALQPLLVAPALHLVQPQRLAHALPKRAARHGNAHGAQPQLRQRSTGAQGYMERVPGGCNQDWRVLACTQRSALPHHPPCTHPTSDRTWRQMTEAAALLNPSSHTVPNWPLCFTSTRPAVTLAGLGFTSLTEAATGQDGGGQTGLLGLPVAP